MVKKSGGLSAGNIVGTAVIAVAALIFFGYKSLSAPSSSPTSLPLPAKEELPPPAVKPPVPVGAPLSAEERKKLGIPENLPDDMVRALTSPPPELPDDLKAQLNAPPPELPPDLKAQLNAPPPELPADLKAQLEAPPPELPDDIKRSLATPPRTVSIEEVNGPARK